MSEKVYKIQMDSGEEVFVKVEVIHCPESIRPYGFYAEMSDRSGKVLDSSAVKNLFVTEAEAVAELGIIAAFQVTPCTLCDIF